MDEVVPSFVQGVPMITSKLTSKAQTTIPQAVRHALGLRERDEILYRIEDDHVLMSKAPFRTEEDPFALFTEWAGEADRRDYGKL